MTYDLEVVWGTLLVDIRHFCNQNNIDIEIGHGPRSSGQGLASYVIFTSASDRVTVVDAFRDRLAEQARRFNLETAP